MEGKEKGRGGVLRRAIEVVKKGGAIGVMGFAATRRPTASNERRRSIVGVSNEDEQSGDARDMDCVDKGLAGNGAKVVLA